jgi:hypothetical protein
MTSVTSWRSRMSAMARALAMRPAQDTAIAAQSTTIVSSGRSVSGTGVSSWTASVGWGV